VARYLRGGADVSRPVVAREVEFRLEADRIRLTPHTPELFFCRDLQGYGWCVRKGEYLNVGIGRRDSRDFGRHVRDFVRFLENRGTLTQRAPYRWRGHAYLASGLGARPLVGPGMLLVGDAAGLAYPESGEGIRPAIESGRLAAETLIASNGGCTVADLQPYASALRRLHPPVTRNPAALRGVLAVVGRALLRSPAFTRHIVLDRWFLRPKILVGESSFSPSRRPPRRRRGKTTSRLTRSASDRPEPVDVHQTCSAV
jgi:menaquinone-9 beta-reductase